MEFHFDNLSIVVRYGGLYRAIMLIFFNFIFMERNPVREAEAFSEGFNSIEEYNTSIGSTCPRCGSDKFDYDGDTMVCDDCHYCE